MPEVRLAEVIAAISLAADLGAGQPPEHALRTRLLACRIAADARLSGDERSPVYHVALLRSLGCTMTIWDVHGPLTQLGVVPAAA